MRLRSGRRNLVVWTSSAGPADSTGVPGFRQHARTRRIHWWIRTGALFAVIGLMRLPRAVRTRWWPLLLLAGGGLTAAGLILSSGVAFFLGLLVLLLAMLIPSDSPAVFIDPGLMPFLVDAPTDRSAARARTSANAQ